MIHKFDITKFDESTGYVEGYGYMEMVDLENEIILKSAVEDALENYMVLPAISYEHKDRTIGLAEEVRFVDGNKLFIKAKLKNTPDNKDIWDGLKNKSINGFSMSGRRKLATRNCNLDPSVRTSPCVTAGIDLFAFTLCRTPANPGALITDYTPPATVDEFYKAIESSSGMVHERFDDNMPCHNNKQIEKSDDGGSSEGSQSIESKLDKLIEIVGKLVESDKKVHSSFEKGVTMKEQETKQETPAYPGQGDTISKSVTVQDTETPAPETPTAFEVRFDEFIKSLDAKIENKLAEIDTRLASIDSKLKTLEDETGPEFAKSQEKREVVIIPEQIPGKVANDGNVGAIEKFFARRK